MSKNEIGDAIIDTAMALHKELGPGLFETVYCDFCQFIGYGYIRVTISHGDTTTRRKNE